VPIPVFNEGNMVRAFTYIDDIADVLALESDFGYHPKTSVEEDIPRFVEWYVDYYKVQR